MNFQSLMFCMIFLALQSCSDNLAEKDATYISGQDEKVESAQNKTTIEKQRKLIKKGHVVFETADLGKTHRQISEALHEFNAYVAFDKQDKRPNRVSRQVEVKVAPDDFDRFLEMALSGVESFDDRSIRVEDVTERFIDIKARVNTKKALEKRYLALLDDAKEMKEIFSIEKEMSKLREEIESVEARLRKLEHQITYSSITFEFYEVKPQNTTFEFGNKLKDAFRSGWNGFLSIVISLTYLWPLFILTFIVVISVLVYKKRIKKA